MKHIEKKSFAEIFNYWSIVKSMNYSDKAKAYRKITFDIKSAYVKGSYSITELDFFIKVLDTTRKETTLQQKIISEWLELSGYRDAKTLLTKKGRISVDAATITMFDSDNSSHIMSILSNDRSEHKLISALNSGKIYMFSTGGDDTFNVQVRITDGVVPQVSMKEMEYVSCMGPSYDLHVPSGKIVVSDLWDFEPTTNSIRLSIEPGFYKLKVFYFNLFPKASSYYIVLCRAHQPRENVFEYFQDLDILEG